jgi:hypothetical protein
MMGGFPQDSTAILIIDKVSVQAVSETVLVETCIFLYPSKCYVVDVQFKC